MTTAAVAARFVELCSQFKNFDAMKELYADNIVSVEASPGPNGSQETPGKAAVIAKSVAWAGLNEIHGASCTGPYILDNRFAVNFVFEITPKSTGKRISVAEIAVYTVEDGKITREEFFYGNDAADGLKR